MRLPKKITPCPIVEAIIELRFESNFPPDAVFGLMYGKFAAEYPDLQTLPITQIPEQIRAVDPNLIFKPHYRISNGNFMIQTGPRVLAFVCNKTYVGWDIFSKKAKETMKVLEDLKIVKKIVRMGIRYINFFSEDIFTQIKPEINLSQLDFEAKAMFFRSQIQGGKFTSSLQISNDAEIANPTKKKGSIIDIDTVLENTEINPSSVSTLLEEAHVEEKRVFYSLIKDDFLSKFNPEYDDIKK